MTRSLPLLSPGRLAAVSLAAAAAVGALLAINLGVGMLAALGLVYLAMTMLNLPFAIMIWVPLVFVLPFVGGLTAVSAVIVVAWLGTLRGRIPERRHVLREHSWLLGAFFLYLVWVTLSLAWAENPGLASDRLIAWYAAFLMVAVVITSILSERHLRLVMTAVVIGAVLSVAVGLVLGAVGSGQGALGTAASVEGRLGGGSGDPNDLAAGLVPAIILAIALIAVIKGPLGRLALAASVVLLGAGLAETQSRGGLLSALAAALMAVVVFKRSRPQTLAVLSLVAALTCAWLVSTPGAWSRVTSVDQGGSGRTDIWRVAWRVSGHDPLLGVGLNNFTFQEKRFVREPGQLTAVALITGDKPHVVHNVYLQALSELGVPGLILLLMVMLGCMGATGRAIRRLDAAGRSELATLARALLVAQVAVGVSEFFLSIGDDKRVWLLFALGPVVATLGSRASRQRSPALAPVSDGRVPALPAPSTDLAAARYRVAGRRRLKLTPPLP